MATRIRDKGQVTIPAHVREAAHLTAGTVVEFVVTDAGVLMQPKVEVLVDPEDAWFYSEEWRTTHGAAVAELDRGQGTTHESGDDFLHALANL